jgi:hypothetical protein
MPTGQLFYGLLARLGEPWLLLRVGVTGLVRILELAIMNNGLGSKNNRGLLGRALTSDVDNQSSSSAKLKCGPDRFIRWFINAVHQAITTTMQQMKYSAEEASQYLIHRAESINRLHRPDSSHQMCRSDTASINGSDKRASFKTSQGYPKLCNVAFASRVPGSDTGLLAEFAWLFPYPPINGRDSPSGFTVSSFQIR